MKIGLSDLDTPINNMAQKEVLLYRCIAKPETPSTPYSIGWIFDGLSESFQCNATAAGFKCSCNHFLLAYRPG